MSDFSFEWNGSYGNAALKPKKFFSIKIPIWDYLESDYYKLTRFPLGLRGSTAATTASAFSISEESRNLRWNCSMNFR